MFALLKKNLRNPQLLVSIMMVVGSLLVAGLDLHADQPFDLKFFNVICC